MRSSRRSGRAPTWPASAPARSGRPGWRPRRGHRVGTPVAALRRLAQEHASATSWPPRAKSPAQTGAEARRALVEGRVGVEQLVQPGEPALGLLPGQRDSIHRCAVARCAWTPPSGRRAASPAPRSARVVAGQLAPEKSARVSRLRLTANSHQLASSGAATQQQDAQDAEQCAEAPPSRSSFRLPPCQRTRIERVTHDGDHPDHGHREPWSQDVVVLECASSWASTPSSSARSSWPAGPCDRDGRIRRVAAGGERVGRRLDDVDRGWATRPRCTAPRQVCSGRTLGRRGPATLIITRSVRQPMDRNAAPRRAARPSQAPEPKRIMRSTTRTAT